MALEFKVDNLLCSEYVLLVARMQARISHANTYERANVELFLILMCFQNSITFIFSFNPNVSVFEVLNLEGDYRY